MFSFLASTLQRCPKNWADAYALVETLTASYTPFVTEGVDSGSSPTLKPANGSICCAPNSTTGSTGTVSQRV